jgi:hypothetical protein
MCPDAAGAQSVPDSVTAAATGGASTSYACPAGGCIYAHAARAGSQFCEATERSAYAPAMA